MLKIVQAGTGRPISYPLDPNATFEPGMIAQLKMIGNDIVMGVSDGTAPIGIIDDIKTVAFTQAVVDEIVIISVSSSTFDGYKFVSTAPFKQELANANIVPSSFRVVNGYPGLQLNSINGVLTAPTGSTLNATLDGSDTPNAIQVIVSYAFYVPNIPGEDSTTGSGKVTLWFTRGVFETDQFESVAYQVNATLFVSSAGKLTAEQTRSDQPGVAICTLPPTAHNPKLQFIWF